MQKFPPVEYIKMAFLSDKPLPLFLLLGEMGGYTFLKNALFTHVQ